MKSSGISRPATLSAAFLLTAMASHGDVLSKTSSFLRSATPSYTADSLDGSSGVVDGAFAPFSPADSDLGVQQILQPTPPVAPIYLTLGVDFQYTDNAPAAIGVAHDRSALMAALAGISWRPHIDKGWFADIGLSQEYYDFDDGDAMDFENGLFYVGVVKNMVDLDDTIFFARLEHQRITTGSLFEGDYHANRVRTGLQKSLFSTPHHEITGGISAAFDLSGGPDALERDEYALELAHTYSITPNLFLTTSARSVAWNYDQGGRDDSLNIIGTELSYNLSESSSITAGLFYTQNDSNTPFGFNDYKSWQGGLSLGYVLSF